MAFAQLPGKVVAGLGSPGFTVPHQVDQLVHGDFMDCRPGVHFQFRISGKSSHVFRCTPWRQLEKMKLLREMSEAKRDRVYCAKVILDILEEPARLTPAETF